MLDILILQKNIQKEFKKNDKEIAGKLDYDEIEFPVQEKDFKKIEEQIIYALMYLVMKMGWFFQFMFQIKNLKTQ